MSGWRLVVDQGKSFVFSGHTADIQDATLQELKRNPEVVWWRDNGGTRPILFPLAGLDCWICGAVFDTNTKRNGLFSIRIPSSLTVVFCSLRATSHELFEEAMNLVFGKESKLTGATLRLEWVDHIISFSLVLPDLLSKSYDWRFAPRMA